MDEVRENQAEDRVPVQPSYNPAQEQFGWLVIIALTAGLDVAAIDSAAHEDHEVWLLIFGGLVTAKLIMYAKIAWRWSRLFE